MQNPAIPAFKRYYTDECLVNPEFKHGQRIPLALQIHALYTHWWHAHFEPRDFPEAVAHATDLFMVEYFMSGRPSFSGELVECPSLALATPKSLRADTRLRFYEEEGELNHRVDDSQFRQALAGFFVNWAIARWNPRDFTQAARDCAVGIVADHRLCVSFSGLGGGKTGSEFLATPYQD